MNGKHNRNITSSPIEGEKQDESVVQNSANKKRKHKEIAIFGNYRHYYGYRVGQGVEEDPRLNVMKKEWFEGKDCLDIGCNAGLFTISVAKRFCCRSIRGIDIDSARISDAYLNLRNIVRENSRMMASENVKPVEAEKMNSPECKTIDPSSRKSTTSGDQCNLQEKGLLDVVSFERENFVWSLQPAGDKQYEAILCLSVTKWIQLNWGDNGLITLFVKIWRLLQPGGIFIVEPQPWKSYYNNRHVSETTRTNYKNITIHPEDFQYILLDKIGFKRVENLTANLVGSKSGFERPILAFWK